MVTAAIWVLWAASMAFTGWDVWRFRHHNHLPIYAAGPYLAAILFTITAAICTLAVNG